MNPTVTPETPNVDLLPGASDQSMPQPDPPHTPDPIPPPTPDPIPPPTEPTPEPHPGYTSVRDAFSEHAAWDLSQFESDDKGFVGQVAEGVKQLQEQAQQYQSAAQQYQQLQADPDFQAWQQSRQTPTEQPQPPAAAQPEDTKDAWDWQPVPYDPQWANLLTRDDQGNIVPRSSGIDPALPEKYRRGQEWLQQQQADFFTDPRQLVTKAMQPVISGYDAKLAALEAKLNEASKQQTEATELQQIGEILTANAKLNYQTDDQGQPKQDPLTGHFLVTPQGRTVEQYTEALKQDGLNQVKALQLAQYIVAKEDAAGQFAQQPPPAPQQPPPTGEQKRDLFVDRLRQTGRNGGPGTTPQYRSDHDLTEQMLNDARTQGLIRDE